MSGLIVDNVETWVPHESVRPVFAAETDGWRIETNGRQSCVGAWRWRFPAVIGGATYRITLRAVVKNVDNLRDALLATVKWGMDAVELARPNIVRQDVLLPVADGADAVVFSRTVSAPKSAKMLAVQGLFRWSSTGSVRWQAPTVTVAECEPAARRTVRICAATGTRATLPTVQSVADNVAYYAGLCERAADAGAQLVLLPEIALQWRLPGNSLDYAVSVPGAETGVFAEIARRRRMRIGLGTLERDGALVRNSLLLISPDGRIDGCYRKVHLATSEAISGTVPGDAFPVFDTECGRIGCNICMDTSAAESSRMVGLNGADILLLSIMGDHRADRFSMGPPVYSEDRWRAIMRVRCLDNQFVLVAARNEGQGSCVIDQKGDFLAWNEGDRDLIVADVDLDPDYRVWNGSSFRDVNWMQRRPHIYGAFVAPNNHGALR